MPHINYKRNETRTFVVRHEPYCTVSGRLRFYKHRHDSLAAYRQAANRKERRAVKCAIRSGVDGAGEVKVKKHIIADVY